MSHPQHLPLSPTDRIIHLHENPDPDLSSIPKTVSKLPDWLQTQIPSPPTVIPLTTEQTFGNMFEMVCDQLAAGYPLSQIISRDHRDIDMARFMRWIYRDEARLGAYHEALRIGAAVIFAQDMLDIADADDSMEDVARSKLKLDTRWKYLAICDRDRYGDVKKIDQSVTIDLGAAMMAARERTRMIEVNPDE